MGGMWKVLKPVFKRGYRHGVRFMVNKIAFYAGEPSKKQERIANQLADYRTKWNSYCALV